jgi:hypothetical protein
MDRVVLRPRQGRVATPGNITDPTLLEAELARVRTEYNSVRLHEAIRYVTPDDEHQGRGEAIRQAAATASTAPGNAASTTIAEPAPTPAGRRHALGNFARHLCG